MKSIGDSSSLIFPEEEVTTGTMISDWSFDIMSLGSSICILIVAV
ncbi:Uncharacterised protein [Chlamydia trachomatis]|nr:Uncharacterised protein [Chlamydia trachomatis]